jgi:glutamate-1-semialdehyde aminotransferase
MDNLAPVGAVYQAGTLSGNPLATAAGLAVLAHLDDARYAELEHTAERFEDGLRKAFADAGTVAQVTRAFTLVGVFFADQPVTNYAEAQLADHEVERVPLPATVRRPVVVHPDVQQDDPRAGQAAQAVQCEQSIVRFAGRLLGQVDWRTRRRALLPPCRTGA